MDSSVPQRDEAAERSRWVPEEAYFLSYRQRNLDRQIRVIPVFLDGYSEKNLKAENCPFQPARLDVTQAIALLSDALDLAPILDALEPVRSEYEDWLPWRDVERYVADKLDSCNRAVEAVAEELGSVLDPYDEKLAERVKLPDGLLGEATFERSL